MSCVINDPFTKEHDNSSIKVDNPLDISKGFNPRRRIALVLKGRKKPLPLSGAGELKPLLQVEEEGARLAKFLEVNLEGLK